MADIFNSKPGFVTSIENMGPRLLPGKIQLEEEVGSAYIMAGIDYQQETIQQFQLSMRDSIYVYMFGDGMGKIALNGLIFSATCVAATAFESEVFEDFPQLAPRDEGLPEAMALYEKYRASVRADPVKVLVGSRTVVGYLTQFNISMIGAGDDPGALGIHRFSMTINTIPNAENS